MNPFEILEIAPGASADDIKAAYHQLAKQWHPDRFSGEQKTAAEEKFRQLAEAFSLLKDPYKREDLERQYRGAAQPAAPSVELDAPKLEFAAPVRERTPESWYAEAQEALNAGQADRALGLVQYAIKLDGEKADYHVFLAKILTTHKGDKKLLVKALEMAVRLNPKDVESLIQLAETFQELGMFTRSSKLWETARNIAPNHRVFVKQRKNAEAAAKKEGLAGQVEQLRAKIQGVFDRLLNRG